MNEKTENDKNDEKETSIVNKINDYFKMPIYYNNDKI